MAYEQKTLLFNPLGTEFLEKFEKAYLFIAKQLGLTVSTKIIDKQPGSIATTEHLIIIIDELSLNSIINDNNWVHFFENSRQIKQRVLIIIDDIDIDKLPVLLSYYPIFSVPKTIVIDDELLDTDNKNNSEPHIVQTAYDIVQYQTRVENSDNAQGFTIFLGPCDEDTTDVFQKTVRELLTRNHKITPQVFNPTAKELLDNRQMFAEILRQTDFAIQFIGHQALINYPETLSPTIEINKILADYCMTDEGSNLQRVVYIPAQNQDIDELLNLKISNFKSDLKNLKNAELIQSPIEKFKSIVLHKIEQMQLTVQKPVFNNQTSDVYFIYPPAHEQQIEKYLKYFESKKIDYSKSQVELDQLELLTYHKKQLVTCKGVVIYNNGNHNWLQRKLSDLIKAPGWGRNNIFDYIIICGQAPTNKILEQFNVLNINILPTTENGPETLSKYFK